MDNISASLFLDSLPIFFIKSTFTHLVNDTYAFYKLLTYKKQIQTNFFDLIDDVFHIICSLISFSDQLHLRSTCKSFRFKIKFSEFDSGFIKKIDRIIKQCQKIVKYDIIVPEEYYTLNYAKEVSVVILGKKYTSKELVVNIDQLIKIEYIITLLEINKVAGRVISRIRIGQKFYDNIDGKISNIFGTFDFFDTDDFTTFGWEEMAHQIVCGLESMITWQQAVEIENFLEFIKKSETYTDISIYFGDVMYDDDY